MTLQGCLGSKDSTQVTLGHFVMVRIHARPNVLMLNGLRPGPRVVIKIPLISRTDTRLLAKS